MPRRKRHRRISGPPESKGFQTIGNLGRQREPIWMSYEEYEAIRLNDYLKLGQEDGAGQMDVSRSTFARIYDSARKKVARSLVEGRPIVFSGGDVYFNHPAFRCKKCANWFRNSSAGKKPDNCTICSSTDIEQFHENVNYKFNS
ncbi:DUF134 domain-containing protein [Gaoshiqia sediminis]|uniref:UPF0251 protein N2K84_16420 n=1 Tax=Gaoshiqia sediminis TaxID=2986998 RepID=A0AA41YAF5_9BACT|nr:DUF134 domain-containing protein [Gaoshiqia sediminis]MCW0484327.1 DUF134 domain-containing protein [Gaoshiqia sediminis]